MHLLAHDMGNIVGHLQRTIAIIRRNIQSHLAIFALGIAHQHSDRVAALLIDASRYHAASRLLIFLIYKIILDIERLRAIPGHAPRKKALGVERLNPIAIAVDYHHRRRHCMQYRLISPLMRQNATIQESTKHYASHQEQQQ